MPHSDSAAVTAVAAAEASTAAVVAADSTAEAVGASMVAVAAVVFTAGAEDSTAVALPAAVAGFRVVADIAAAPTEACAPTVAVPDPLVVVVITGADRQQAGARTAGSVPRAA